MKLFLGILIGILLDHLWLGIHGFRFRKNPHSGGWYVYFNGGAQRVSATTLWNGIITAMKMKRKITYRQ